MSAAGPARRRALPAERVDERPANRRRHPRVPVTAVATLATEGAPLAVWIVQNLSRGGASLVGVADAILLPGQHLRFAIHAPGRRPLPLPARILRRQLATRAGRCAVVFDHLSPEQVAAIDETIEAAAVPPGASPAASLVVGRASIALGRLVQGLRPLGHEPRLVESPLDAAAWLQRERAAAAVLVEEASLDVDGFHLLEFVREMRPEVKRIAIAKGVHSFRLNQALRAGLADAVIEPPFEPAALAARLRLLPARAPALRGRGAR